MMPKEHGSWAVLAAPILVGLAAAGGGPAPAVLLFCAAALGGFLVRVPLQSLVSAHPAPRALFWLLLDSALAGAGGLALLLVYGRWGLLLFALPAGALLAYNLRANLERRTFSFANELAGIFGLCLGAPAAYYAAAGFLAPAAWTAWALSALYFLGPVFDVKAAALRHRAASDRAALPALASMTRASLAYHAAVLAAVAGAAAAGVLHPLAAAPFAASLHKTWRRGRLAPVKVDFRALGYQEIGYAVFFALALGAGFRLKP